MSDRSGQQLGSYRLLRLLGRGGFAEVYLGQHLYLNSQAALKVLQIALNDEDIEHFAKEARTLASLTHPHIIRVLDYAVENGTPFLVMEYAPGGSLRHQHPIGNRLPLDIAEPAEPLLDGFDGRGRTGGAVVQDAYYRNCLHRLRSHRAWSDKEATGHRAEERAPCAHWITSSARASSA